MARRPFTVFSLSFLDVMACGLGATILFLMIISAQVAKRGERANDELLQQASALEQQLRARRAELARTADATEPVPRGEIERLQKLVTEMREKTEQTENDSIARETSIEQLRSDVQRLEEAKARLAVSTEKAATGTRMRSLVGEGNRQYLTGMKMGGRRVLILVDASSSMLARTYVNILRYRAMPEARRLRAPKWQQTLSTVEWLTSNIKSGTRYQIYVFNETARSVLTGTDTQWIEVNSPADLDAGISALRKIVPAGGTSLIKAFEAARLMVPVPDNIYLITDGLPTQGRDPPSNPEPVSASKRLSFFNQAFRSLPSKVPVNTILLAMDGDPAAAKEFWELAQVTRGSLLAPAKDWP